MSKMERRLLRLLGNEPGRRSTMEIDFVIPWFRKISNAFDKIKNDVLREIIRNVYLKQCVKNELLIKQGDTGDCMYILVSGTVDIFIGKDIEEETDKDAQTDSGVDFTEDKVEIVSYRKQYGKCVVTFESGKSFGEIALINRDNKRTASVIANDEAQVIVISRALYGSTLKGFIEAEFKMRHDFISEHPLFTQLHEKYQGNIEKSLYKETYSPDTTIVKQGDTFSGLYFIVSGQAQILIQPDKHEQQYPNRRPFVHQNDVYELELYRPRRHSLSNDPLKQAEREQVLQKNDHKTASKHIRVKRKDGYAAAERRITHRNSVLTMVGEGEVIGDFELTLGLPTYTQTVLCTATTVVYSLTAANVDRLISNSRRLASVMELMRSRLVSKLQTRLSVATDYDIPLYRHLLFTLTDEVKPQPKPEAPPLTRVKTFHGKDKEILLQHLIASFQEDKAPLIEPMVPESVYHKRLMREKIKEREEEIKKNPKKLKKAKLPEVVFKQATKVNFDELYEKAAQQRIDEIVKERLRQARRQKSQLNQMNLQHTQQTQPRAANEKPVSSQVYFEEHTSHLRPIRGTKSLPQTPKTADTKSSRTKQYVSELPVSAGTHKSILTHHKLLPHTPGTVSFQASALPTDDEASLASEHSRVTLRESHNRERLQPISRHASFVVYSKDLQAEMEKLKSLQTNVTQENDGANSAEEVPDAEHNDSDRLLDVQNNTSRLPEISQSVDGDDDKQSAFSQRGEDSQRVILPEIKSDTKSVSSHKSTSSHKSSSTHRSTSSKSSSKSSSKTDRSNQATPRQPEVALA